MAATCLGVANSCFFTGLAAFNLVSSEESFLLPSPGRLTGLGCGGLCLEFAEINK